MNAKQLGAFVLLHSLSFHALRSAAKLCWTNTLGCEGVDLLNRRRSFLCNEIPESHIGLDLPSPGLSRRDGSALRATAVTPIVSGGIYPLSMSV